MTFSKFFSTSNHTRYFYGQQAFFSIGEVAKAVGITRKTILNYETKGLVKPDQKESATANRYYTIDTITRIRTIRVFQDLDLSLEEICAYFNKDSDLEPMIRFWKL